MPASDVTTPPLERTRILLEVRGRSVAAWEVVESAWWRGEFPRVEPLPPLDDLALLGRSLAWRLLAAHDERPLGALAAAAAHIRESWLRNAQIPAADLPAVLASRGIATAWFEQLLQAEVLYQQACRRLLAPARRARALLAWRTSLTRVRLESLLLADEDAAREAVLCLRDDRLSVTELAALIGIEAGRHEAFLDTLAPEVQQYCLTVPPGDMLPPRLVPGGCVVERLAARIEPAPDDPQVAARVEHRLLAAAFADGEREHVRWHVPVVLVP